MWASEAFGRGKGLKVLHQRRKECGEIVQYMLLTVTGIRFQIKLTQVNGHVCMHIVSLASLVVVSCLTNISRSSKWRIHHKDKSTQSFDTNQLIQPHTITLLTSSKAEHKLHKSRISSISTGISEAINLPQAKPRLRFQREAPNGRAGGGW